jgi:hypothetical protein
MGDSGGLSRSWVLGGWVWLSHKRWLELAAPSRFGIGQRAGVRQCESSTLLLQIQSRARVRRARLWSCR